MSIEHYSPGLQIASAEMIPSASSDVLHSAQVLVPLILPEQGKSPNASTDGVRMAAETSSSRLRGMVLEKDMLKDGRGRRFTTLGDSEGTCGKGREVGACGGLSFGGSCG